MTQGVGTLEIVGANTAPREHFPLVERVKHAQQGSLEAVQVKRLAPTAPRVHIRVIPGRQHAQVARRANSKMTPDRHLAWKVLHPPRSQHRYRRRPLRHYFRHSTQRCFR